MIRFAGVDLLLEDAEGELAEFLSRHIPARFDSLIGDPDGDRGANITDGSSTFAHPNWPDAPPLALNQLYWPTGASRFGHIVCLATTEQLREILANLTPTGSYRVSLPDENGNRSKTYIPPVTEALSDGLLILADGEFDDPLPLEHKAEDLETADLGYKLDESGRVALITPMVLLPPRPIVQVREPGESSSSDPQAIGPDPDLWLLPLVDERFRWQSKVAESLDLTGWQELIDGLASDLGIEDFELAPEPHEDYCDPGQQWDSRGFSAAVLLDLAAAHIGRRVLRYPDGSVDLPDVSAGAEQYDANLRGSREAWALIAGGPTELIGNAIPASVRFLFTADCTTTSTTTTAGTTTTSTTTTAAGPVDSVDYRDLLEGGRFYDSAEYKLPDLTPNPALTAVFRLASEQDGEFSADLERFARDFYGWQTTRFDFTFASVRMWHLTGFEDALLFQPGTRLGDGQRLGQTRVWSLSASVWPRELWRWCPESDWRPEGTIELALASESIDPDSAGAFVFADDDWTSTGETGSTRNDSGVTIPNGTRLILARKRCLWRTVTAFICEE